MNSNMIKGRVTTELSTKDYESTMDRGTYHGGWLDTSEGLRKLYRGDNISRRTVGSERHTY